MPDNTAPEVRRQRIRGTIVGLPLLVLLSPILLVLAVIWLLAALGLHVAALVLWAPRGRRVLFVYSDSPVWKDHIERTLLPRLPRSAVVLNWSERSRWPSLNLAVWLFRFYAGRREYNPFALVIRPLRGPKTFRFWRAFREFKHGKEGTLRRLEAKFFREIGTA